MLSLAIGAVLGGGDRRRRRRLVPDPAGADPVTGSLNVSGVTASDETLLFAFLKCQSLLPSSAEPGSGPRAAIERANSKEDVRHV